MNQPWNEMLEVDEEAWTLEELAQYVDEMEADPLEDLGYTQEEYEDWVIAWTSMRDVYKERQRIREVIEYLEKNYESFVCDRMKDVEVHGLDEDPQAEEVIDVVAAVANADNLDDWIEYRTEAYEPVELWENDE